MKRETVGKLLGILIGMGMICGIFAQSVFAESSFQLVSAFPENEGKGYELVNQMARLVFSTEVPAEGNEKCFRVLNSKDEEEPIKVLEQKNQPERVNLLFEKDLAEDSEYRILIDAGLKSAAGDTLGEDITITFRTKSVKKESLVTTGLMVVMFAAIIIMTIREQTKKQDSEPEGKGKKKVNPYKEAKKEAEKIVAQRKKERKEAMESWEKKQKKKK